MEWVLPVAVSFLLLAILAVGIAAYALHHAIGAKIEVKALQNSTHQVQFEPVEFPQGGDDPEEVELNKAMDKEERDGWKRLAEVHAASDGLF
jgi:hypothetical protein